MGRMRQGDLNQITHPQQRAFLAAFRETGNVRLACQAAKVGRSSHYRWSEEDPSYQRAFEMAKQDAADILEAEAQRRAVEGVEKPTGWYRGQAGGKIREYSDLLLIFLLKGLRPDVYRERQEIELRGMLHKVDVGKLPQWAIERLSEGEDYRIVLNDLETSAVKAAGVAGLLGPGKHEGQGDS